MQPHATIQQADRFDAPVYIRQFTPISHPFPQGTSFYIQSPKPFSSMDQHALYFDENTKIAIVYPPIKSFPSFTFYCY